MAVRKEQAAQGNQGEVASQEEVTLQADATAVNVPAVIVGNLFAGMDLEEMGFSEEELKSLTGMDALGTSEIRIPYAQLMSKDSTKHKKGDIVFADGTVISGSNGEIVEGISVLKVQPVRVMFPSPFNPNNDFICRSIDGIQGHTDGAYPGRKCDECEFSQYPEAGGASPCRDQRLLLCAKDDGGLFFIQIGGIGVGVWKTFMSSQLFHLLPKAKNLLGAFNLNMAVKTIDTNFGPFPAIDFKIADKNKPFVEQYRLIGNLNSLKSFKEFENQHLETAATATKAAMATGSEETTAAAGQNGALF